MVFVEHQHHLIIGSRPCTVHQIVIIHNRRADQLTILSRHDLGEAVIAHPRHHTHAAVHAGGATHAHIAVDGAAIRIDQRILRIVGKYAEFGSIGVNHAVFSQIGANFAGRIIQILLKLRQIVLCNRAGHGGNDLQRCRV